MGIYLVMKNNFRRCFHHKMLFAVTLLMPVLLCLILGFIRFDKVSIRVGILDAQKDGLSAEEKEKIYEILDESEGISYAAASSRSLNTDLMTGRFQVILDYTRSSKAVQFNLLTYQNKDRSNLMETAFHSAIAGNKPIKLSGYRAKGLSAEERSFALLLSLFLIFSSIYTASLIRDRQEGMLQRYLFAKRGTAGYVMGYLLQVFTMTLFQALICMGILSLIQKNFQPVLLETMLISTVTAVISSAFAILICLGSKSEVQANITASALAAVMSLLGGTFTAIEAMPWLLRMLSFASPIRWVVELSRLF